MNGKHLYNGATKKFESSVSLGYITYNNKNTIVSVNVSGSGSSDLYFYGMSTPTYVKMDGSVYGGWSMSDSTTLKISKTSGTHSFEFNGGGGTSDGNSNVVPVAAFTGTPLSGTSPLAVTFTDSSTGTSITNRRWDFGDGNISTYTTATNPSHRYANPGTYTVNLSVTNASGSNSLKRTSYITVTALPVTPVAPVAAFIGTPLSGTAPLAVKFTDTSTGTGISAWKWDFNNDNVIDSSSQNPTYTYTTAGTYTVNLTVTGTGGRDSEVKSKYITVTAAPIGLWQNVRGWWWRFWR
jgi:PKD repeat protein